MHPEDREALAQRSIDAWNSEDWEEQLRAVWNPDGVIVERVDVIESESIDDRVLAHLRWILQGDASGAPLEGEVWLVGEFEDDQFSKMAYFLDRETARTAAEAGE